MISWNLGNKATGQIELRDICFQGFLGSYHLHGRRGRSTFLWQVVNKAVRTEPINSLWNHHLHKPVSFCQKTASKEGLKKRNRYVRLEHYSVLPGIISVLCKCTVQNGSGSLFRNVRRCSWRRRFGVLFLFCLVSFDIPSKPTTPQIFLISPSEAVFSHIWMFVCRTLSPPIK